METLIFLLIIIFGIVSVFEATWTIMGDNKDTDGAFKIIFFITTSVLCFISILYESTKLKDSDVFEGNAEYVETIHISKGDTIKTYHIQTKKME